MRGAVAVVVALVAVAAPARAHKPSDSTLVFRFGPDAAQGRWDIRWDIAVRDLDDVLSIDADGDGMVTWRELRGREADIAGYALSRLSIATAGGPCALTSAPFGIATHSDGAYVSLPLALACPAAGADRQVTLDYRLLFEVDAQHRGLVSAGGATLVLTARDHTRRLALPVAGAAAARPPGSAFDGFAFVADGMRHIWGGLDHVLFLLALLLPAVVRRQQGSWTPVAALRPVLGDVARIVTAFTVAHSLTLSLAALGVVRIPARLTEPAIAASVVLAAVNNLVPVFGRDRWIVAFALGLLHGFGFSSVLADLALPRARLLAALFGFNAGVEIGQLAIVAAFVPLAFASRRTAAYRRLALVGGSGAIALAAAVWLIARILDPSTWS